MYEEAPGFRPDPRAFNMDFNNLLRFAPPHLWRSTSSISAQLALSLPIRRAKTLSPPMAL